MSTHLGQGWAIPVGQTWEDTDPNAIYIRKEAARRAAYLAAQAALDESERLTMSLVAAMAVARREYEACGADGVLPALAWKLPDSLLDQIRKAAAAAAQAEYRLRGGRGTLPDLVWEPLPDPDDEEEAFGGLR